MRRRILGASLLIGLLSLPTQLPGQSFGSRSTGSTQGMFGSRSVGGSLSAGTRSFSSNPLNSSSGLNTGGGLQNQASVGQVDSSSRFVRGNRQAGAFVGADTQEMQDFVGTVQAATGLGGGNYRTGATGIRGGAGRGNTANQPGGRGRGRTNTEVRNTLSVGFRYQAPTTQQIANGLTAVFQRSQKIQAKSPIRVEVRQGTAILRGVVATDHDRDLAGGLARLEAGIWKVQNELVVAGSPQAEPQPLPAQPTEPVAPAPATPPPAPPAD